MICASFRVPVAAADQQSRRVMALSRLGLSAMSYMTVISPQTRGTATESRPLRP